MKRFTVEHLTFTR